VQRGDHHHQVHDPGRGGRGPRLHAGRGEHADRPAPAGAQHPRGAGGDELPDRPAARLRLRPRTAPDRDHRRRCGVPFRRRPPDRAPHRPARAIQRPARDPDRGQWPGPELGWAARLIPAAGARWSPGRPALPGLGYLDEAAAFGNWLKDRAMRHAADLPGLDVGGADHRLAVRALGPAGRGDLGDPRRPQELHLRPVPGLGGPGPRDPAGRAPRPARQPDQVDRRAGPRLQPDHGARLEPQGRRVHPALRHRGARLLAADDAAAGLHRTRRPAVAVHAAGHGRRAGLRQPGLPLQPLGLTRRAGRRRRQLGRRGALGVVNRSAAPHAPRPGSRWPSRSAPG
jgi:hypothetical protein